MRLETEWLIEALAVRVDVYLWLSGGREVCRGEDLRVVRDEPTLVWML